MTETALLALEDGTFWQGAPFGARSTRTGEVVFNTSPTGYQEVLTDPSYCGQIVVMTTAHVGNTGTNAEDAESERAWLAGFAVREVSGFPSNWRSTASLDGFLREQNVVGITNLDTRGLVRHIRSKGALRGALSSVNPNPEQLLALARLSPPMNGADMVQFVTCADTRGWNESIDPHWYAFTPTQLSPKSFHVVAYDYGIKYSSLRMLTARNCRVTVVPAATGAADVLALKPDGVLLSNGPGDPAAVTYAIESVRGLLGRVPVFGICLGHQILALALGGTTYKLLFGHRGSNQPVKNCKTGKVEITTHNHGFAVRADSLPQGVEITHINLNDQCVEGLAAREQRAFSVQFHPEAAAGPHDAMALFDEFVAAMGER